MSLFFIRYQKSLRWLPALCFAIAIFLFSATPGTDVKQSYHSIETTVQSLSPAISPSIRTASSTFDWLKVAHGIGYFWLGFTVLYALSSRSRWSPAIALVLCALYAVTDEFHQSFVPYRSASPKDVLIDTLAALGGVTMMLCLIKLKTFLNSKSKRPIQS